MPDRTASLTGLHRFALLTAAATLVLIAAGGLVTSTESGLSVPDWPTTYGQNMFTFPPSKWVGGIRFEHGHRLIASLVGLLTVVLAVWLARSEPRRWVVRLGWAALAAVVAQGILGGITVLFLLPLAVSVAHACLAQAFFCLTVVLATVTASSWRAGRSVEASGLRRAAAVAVTVIFAQLLVGAVMRHAKAGLAIPDFPLSLGRVVPPWTGFPVAIAFAHRVGALLVAVAVLLVVREAFRSKRGDLRRAALIPLLLLVVQVALGAATVLTGKAVAVTTAHVATGALLLGATLSLGVRGLRAPRLRLIADEAPAVARGGAAPRPAGKVGTGWE